MARPVKVRDRYTSERTRLARLEEAVEKDPRITDAEKSALRDLLHRLTAVFTAIDDRLPSLPAPRGRRARRAA